MTLTHIPGADGAAERRALGKSLNRALLERMQRHGKIFRTDLGVPVVFAVGLEANRTILSTSFRDYSTRKAYEPTTMGALFRNSLIVAEHDAALREREILQPAISRTALAECSGALWDVMRAAADALHDDNPRDALELTSRTAFTAAARTLLGMEPMVAQLELTHRRIAALLDASRAPRFWARALRARRALIASFLPVIRRARRTTPGGMLGLLVRHRRADGKPLTPTQIADHLLLLLWASYDTSAAMAAWTLYELAKAPQWQERIHEELLEAGVLDGAAPDAIGALKSMAMVLREVERLRPIGGFFMRVAETDQVLLNHAIPAGTVVAYSAQLSHRVPELFPDPEAFRPERWDPSRPDVPPPNSLVGFGQGPRVCLGKAFALLQLKILLATLIPRFRFELTGRKKIRFDEEPVHRPVHATLRFIPRKAGGVVPSDAPRGPRSRAPRR